MTNLSKVHIFTPDNSIDYIAAHTHSYMEKKQRVNQLAQPTNETYLVTLKDHQVIYVSQSQLKIFIYTVADHAEDKMYDFFAELNGQLTGFIVENMGGFDEFHAALAWYAQKINQPFFKLSKERN